MLLSRATITLQSLTAKCIPSVKKVQTVQNDPRIVRRLNILNPLNLRRTAYCLSLYFSADVAQAPGNQNHSDADDADDQRQRAHGPQIAIDVEVIEQRTQGLRAR
jgi:hypothetical protein